MAKWGEINCPRCEELEEQIAAMEEGLTAVHMAGYMDGRKAAEAKLAAAQQNARPIWTAPRDGTRILIAPYGNPTDLQVSWFIEGEDRWANWSWSVEPSHWFPLPVIREGGK